ncbi:hypothetical protein MKX03_012387 [Papaver bracteatum]|nr:hypothetical protein MKX03_012387 [Papaver bracteatum]
MLATSQYIACRQEDKPRTVKVTLSLNATWFVSSGATKKEIGRERVHCETDGVRVRPVGSFSWTERMRHIRSRKIRSPPEEDIKMRSWLHAC